MNNATELVEILESDPDELYLLEPINFRRRSRSNPVSLTEFLSALRSSRTSVISISLHFLASMAERERSLVLDALSQKECLTQLEILKGYGHPANVVISVSALAQVIRTHVDLEELNVDVSVPLRGDEAAFSDLALAIRQHRGLRVVHLSFPPNLARTVMDPVVRALATCTLLNKVELCLYSPISDHALRTLALLPTLRTLYVYALSRAVPCQWHVLASTLSRKSNLQELMLSCTVPDHDACVALARAMAHCSLQRLSLCAPELSDDFGVALAQALRVNRTITEIVLQSLNRKPVALGIKACRALCEMLQVNPQVRIYASCSSNAMWECSPWLGSLMDPAQSDDNDTVLRSKLYEIVFQMCWNECVLTPKHDCEDPVHWVRLLSYANRWRNGQTMGTCFDDEAWTVKFDTPLNDSELDSVMMGCSTPLLQMNPTLCQR